MNPIMHKKSCHFCGMVVESQENSSCHSVSLHFSIVKSCLWFLTTWLAFATWNTLFSHNFDVLNLMMKSDSSHFDCMVLKTQETLFIILFSCFCVLWKVTCDFLESTWMAFETWNTLFSHNFDVLNPNMQRDLSGFDCKAPKSQEHIVFYSVFPWFFKNEITCDFL